MRHTGAVRTRNLWQSPAVLRAIYGVGAVASVVLLWASWRKYVDLGFNDTASFVTGLWCVVLVARNNIWNFPIGLANNVFLALVFSQIRLFNDMSLQGVYFLMGLQGWYLWLRGGSEQSQLPITRASQRQLMTCGFAIVAATPLLMGFSHLVGGASPFWDALTTAISLAAQWLLNAKKLQNWWLWIVADIIYVPLYFVRGAPVIAVLYICFFMLCVAGLRNWQRTLTTDEARSIPAESL